MTHRQQLNEPQIAELFEPPRAERELIRHYTRSAADLAAVRRCRGDHNRLGYALMLCYLRDPGHAVRAGVRPPAPLLAFVATQIDVLPDCWEDYVATGRNRQRHASPCQDQLGLRPGTLPSALEKLVTSKTPKLFARRLSKIACWIYPVKLTALPGCRHPR